MDSEISDILLHAARMPYNWAAVAGRLLGTWSPDNYKFGGSCVDMALYVRDNLPRNRGVLLMDIDYRHFAVEVDRRHYCDPTFNQHSTKPIYDGYDYGETTYYPTLLPGNKISVIRNGDSFIVGIGNLVQYDMRRVDYRHERISIDYAISCNRSALALRKPYLTFVNCDKGVTQIVLDNSLLLDVKDKYINSREVSPEDRIIEMEQNLGFTAEELLRYFVNTWAQLSRVMNTQN